MFSSTIQRTVDCEIYNSVSRSTNSLFRRGVLLILIRLKCKEIELILITLSSVIKTEFLNLTPTKYS